jgi:hypothetical protein
MNYLQIIAGLFLIALARFIRTKYQAALLLIFAFALLVIFTFTGCAGTTAPTADQLAGYEKVVHAGIQDGAQDAKSIRAITE